MKKRIIILVIIFIGIFGLQYYLKKPTQTITSQNSQYGHTIPPLQLSPINTPAFNLNTPSAKLYIVNFWATWCPPCVAETPHFVALNNHYRDQGIRIIGISLDKTISPVTPFIKNKQINYPIIMATPEIIEAFGQVSSIPTTFILDKNLSVIDIAVGYRNQNYFEKVIKRAIK